MKKEYYVTHSKYKSSNRKSWDNALTFAFEGKMKDVKEGTYNFYHKGQLVWSMEGPVDLFDYFEDHRRADQYTDYEESLAFPIFKKYAEDTHKITEKEMAKIYGRN